MPSDFVTLAPEEGVHQHRGRLLEGMALAVARKGYAGGLAFRVVKEELEAEGCEVPELDTDGLSSLG